MNATEYKYLEDTLTGRRARDPQFESKMKVKVEGSIAKAALERERLNASKTHEEREIEQREFSLKMYGRENMLYYAHPMVTTRPLGELAIPGDLIRDVSQARGHNGEEKGRKKDSPQQLKGHSGVEEPEPWCDANGRLLLQTHGGIKQVLQLM